MNTKEDFLIAHVEDDEDDAFMFKMMLKKINYSGLYKRFTTGKEFLEWCREQTKNTSPHLIFLDLKLPGEYGVDILAEVRKLSQIKNIPVLMLSGSNAEHDLTNSMRAGCNGYLVKSSEFEHFQKLCAAYISAWRLEYELQVFV